MINAIPGILNVMIITFLFLLLFAIMSVNFFKGRLYYCVLDTVPEGIQEDIYYKWDCLNSGGEWVNADNNFDNAGNALIALVNA